MHVTLTVPVAKSSAVLTIRDVEISKSGTAWKRGENPNNISLQNDSAEECVPEGNVVAHATLDFLTKII